MCFPARRGEHEIITHQHSSERSCTATDKNVYGIRPVTRELQNTVVWLSCGFDRPPSRDAVDRSPSPTSNTSSTRFDRLVEQAAAAAACSP